MIQSGFSLVWETQSIDYVESSICVSTMDYFVACS